MAVKPIIYLPDPKLRLATALELGYRWLATHQPPAAAPTLVHGDFRNGNLIVDPGGVRAVLDWEAVHVGA